jgi:hypothetical protein
MHEKAWQSTRRAVAKSDAAGADKFQRAEQKTSANPQENFDGERRRGEKRQIDPS